MCLQWLATDVAALFWMDSLHNFKPVNWGKKQKMWKEGNSLYLQLTVNVRVDCNYDFDYDLVFKVSIYQGDLINISVQDDEGLKGS